MKLLLLFLVALSCWVSDAAPRTDPMYDYNVCMQINQERYPYRTAHNMCMNRGKRDESAAESTEEVREKRSDYGWCMLYEKQKIGYDEKEADKYCRDLLAHLNDDSAAESTEEVREKRAAEQLNYAAYGECRDKEERHHDSQTAHHLCNDLLWTGKRDVSAAESTEEVREKRAAKGSNDEFYFCKREYRMEMKLENKPYDEEAAFKKCFHLLLIKREVSAAESTEEVREKRAQWGIRPPGFDAYDRCMFKEKQRHDLETANKLCRHHQCPWCKRDVSAAESTEGVREKRAFEQPDLQAYENCMAMQSYHNRDEDTAHSLCEHFLGLRGSRLHDHHLSNYDMCMGYQHQEMGEKYDDNEAEKRCGIYRPHKRDVSASAESSEEVRDQRSSEDDPMYDYNVCMQINQQRYPYRTAHYMCMNRGKKREVAQPRDIYPPLNPRHPWGI